MLFYCIVCAVLVAIFNFMHLDLNRQYNISWTTYILPPFLQIISCVVEKDFHPQKYAAAGATADD
jgi:hypothetical protein